MKSKIDFLIASIIDKHLNRLIKKKIKNTQTTHVRNRRRNQVADPMVIKGIIREYYKQPMAINFLI